MVEKVIVNQKSQLDMLEKNSALTWEGFSAAEENLEDVFDWIEKYTPVKSRRAYVISGSLMNMAYGLTGDNTYADDLTIVSVMLDDLEEPMKIAIPRFQVGGRWFDDIVDNNARRENR